MYKFVMAVVHMYILLLTFTSPISQIPPPPQPEINWKQIGKLKRNDSVVKYIV